jgi:hypothetical protein
MRRSFTRGTPRGLFGRNGFMATHSIFGEFVAHASPPRFGTLNHAWGASLKTPRIELFGRYPSESGLVMLTLSSSGYDPTRTLAAFFAARHDAPPD